MYSRQLPAHRIFREIFSKEQTDERADIFVCRLRSLLAKLPYELPEETKLDIVYGLLSIRFRDRIPRETLNGLDQLIFKLRSVEEALIELNVLHPSNITTTIPVADPPPSQTYNNKVDNVKHSPTSNCIDNSGQKIIKRLRPKCIYCKIFGHTIDECFKKPKAKCLQMTNPSKLELRDYVGTKLTTNQPVQLYAFNVKRTHWFAMTKPRHELVSKSNKIRENRQKDTEVRNIIFDVPFRGRRSWSDRGFIIPDSALYRYRPQFQISLYVGSTESPVHKRRKRGRPRKLT
ncbi:hypothetical protein K1T71_010380 [Dendrolimus kikuchii]|uniref:Uncharacterized protein n=1 Tax=Dendrolimus kikuchii TaxID=765133 RepID=A0ACC1CS59_9NEOP|nr:hypothetical protein K1T71_010380 [Dendrolimus kikuchii]